MKRDDFEQLVSAWLDEPQREDLRRQIEQTAASDPQWARELDEWQRFEALLARRLPDLPALDWSRLQDRVRIAIDADATGAEQDAALDTLLRRPPHLEHSVDWPRFRARVVAAAVAGRPGRGIRQRRWLVGVAGVAAAAAGLFWTFMPEAGPGTQPPGLAAVTLSGPAARPSGGVVEVRVAISRAPAEAPERFFTIDPPDRGSVSDETDNYY